MRLLSPDGWLTTRRLLAAVGTLSRPEAMGCSTSKPETPTVGSSTNSEYVEDVVCDESDIKENEMKSFDLGGVGRVLLVRQKGKLTALGAKCTHYGAPLVNGALGNGRIRCQWHGACFNIANGDIEDFPGLDSLPCFEVTLENMKVKVRARRQQLETSKRSRPMAKRNPDKKQHIVVVGGGPSGATCVETLRQEGFSGQITLVCKENYLPYDRVKVSKAMDFDIAKAEFRTDQYYNDHGIDVIKGVAATAVDTAEKSVKLENGTVLTYDRLYIATGLQANKADIPGWDLKDVVVLRDYEHAHAVNALLSSDLDVVVLGSSFVGLETANYCVGKVRRVTVVARQDTPLQFLLGKAVGTAVKKLFKDKGVEFVFNSGVVGIEADRDGRVSKVRLVDGSELEANLVVMAIGSSYNTQWLADSQIPLKQDGSVEVDEYLQSGVPGVYVGGDIAYAPVFSHHNKKSTIGHYPLAHYHGKIAALNMMDKRTKLQAVPYFWTMLFGKGLRYAGHGAYDDIVYIGNVDELKFVAYYLDGDEVIAAASIGYDPVVSQFAEILSQEKQLFRKDVEGNDTFTWTKKLQST